MRRERNAARNGARRADAVARGPARGEMRRRKSLRIGVHIANAVVWGPVYRTHLLFVAPGSEGAGIAILAAPRGRPRPRLRVVLALELLVVDHRHGFRVEVELDVPATTGRRVGARWGAGTTDDICQAGARSRLPEASRGAPGGERSIETRRAGATTRRGRGGAHIRRGASGERIMVTTFAAGGAVAPDEVPRWAASV